MQKGRPVGGLRKNGAVSSAGVIRIRFDGRFRLQKPSQPDASGSRLRFSGHRPAMQWRSSLVQVKDEQASRAQAYFGQG